MNTKTYNPSQSTTLKKYLHTYRKDITFIRTQPGEFEQNKNEVYTYFDKYAVIKHENKLRFIPANSHNTTIESQLVDETTLEGEKYLIN
jgi:hypothetical protein